MNWEQLKTILWLRARLMRNQWSRHHGLGAVIAVLVGFGMLAMAVTIFLAALSAGAFGMREAEPSAIMAAWFGVTCVFFFFWMIGLMMELQRSETIDLQKLMHLPAALGQLFVVNYVVSHVSLSIMVMVPAMIGLAIGLAISRGPEMLLLIPLALCMVMMVTAWTYYLRGWLASMMTNPRRRRTVIMCISLAFVMLAQGPNLYFNVLSNHHGNSVNFSKDMLNNLIAVQVFIPPMWLSVGARGLAEKNMAPAIICTLGCLGVGMLGLLCAYRSTVKFYHGETGGKAAAVRRPALPAPGMPPASAPGRRYFLEWHIPAIPEQSAAMALATFRSLLRAPEVKMALGGSVFSILVVGAIVLFRSPPHLPDIAKPFVATGVVMFSTFLLVQFFANQFGFDRDGFRSLILSPADRWLILFGKNLAIVPIGLVLGVITLSLLSAWLHLPLLVMAAALFQLMTLLLISSVGGNLISILVPFRIQPGSMRPTKMPALAMLAMMLCQLLLPLVMAPVFIAPLLEMLLRKGGLPDFVPINLICSVLFCSVMVLCYQLTLAPLGRLLHRRETKILQVVTVEVE